MPQRISNNPLIILLGFLTIALSSHAADIVADPLNVSLSASHYSELEDSWEVVEAMVPGETYRYTATYSNRSATSLTKLVAEIAVPEDTRLVEVDLLDQASVSVDGDSFHSWPMYRQVKNTAGEWETTTVPLDEIKVVKWLVPSLPANADVDFYLAVQVASVGGEQ